MSKGWTITTKDGKTLTAEEWVKGLEEKEKHRLNLEFSKLQEKEVITQRKCLKKRGVKNGVPLRYNKKYSKVRHLTEEEIKKEYKMSSRGIKEGTVTERGDTIRKLIKFLQELEGRKVATDIIVQRIKKPVKSVSSFLSQLFNAGIVARVPMKNHKRKFVWGIAIPYKNGELEAIISLFNDFTAKKRKKQYLDKKKKGTEEEINYEETEPSIPKKEESEKSAELGERLTELIEEEQQQEISTPSSKVLRVVIEGNIKILFGLVK